MGLSALSPKAPPFRGRKSTSSCRHEKILPSGFVRRPSICRRKARFPSLRERCASGRMKSRAEDLLPFQILEAAPRGTHIANQRMHFICIAFSRRKTRAKLRRARSGEFEAPTCGFHRHLCRTCSPRSLDDGSMEHSRKRQHHRAARSRFSNVACVLLVRPIAGATTSTRERIMSKIAARGSVRPAALCRASP
jgi:hypothetical protein